MEFARLPEKHGWTLRRVNGSHHIYGKDGNSARIYVPTYGNAVLKSGLQRYLAKLAGIPD
jgi:predicted RNA binding protein YcfA (HicA-like mRNA interferase family)